MATYTFDDGSTITNDQTPTGWVTSATPATDGGIGSWQDTAEAAKLGQFYPQGPQWWEQAAMYGMTRAVDAAFVRSTVNKTAAPATYAGQNGRTYVAGAVADSGGFAGVSPLVLLLIAGAIVFAVAD